MILYKTTYTTALLISFQDIKTECYNNGAVLNWGVS